MIHHPVFGPFLKKELDPLGVECVVRYAEQYDGQTKDEKIILSGPDRVAFLCRHLGVAPPKPSDLLVPKGVKPPSPDQQNRM